MDGGRSKLSGLLPQGFDWVCIDTCYIDSESSGKLSEANSSMERWYREAKECYVCLSDVQRKRGMDVQNTLKQSSLFTRRWRLQKFLTLFQLVFFDCEWGFVSEE